MTYEERRRVRRRRQRARARRRATIKRCCFSLFAFAVFVLCFTGITLSPGGAAEMKSVAAKTVDKAACVVAIPPVIVTPEPKEALVVEPGPEPEQELEPEAEEGEDPMEAEKIEAALLEQGYFRDDVPLTYELQDYLHTACQEAGVPYALALAVIQKETQFQNLVGDDGCSEGYMQVQRKWHYDRMERLGVTDLMDPFGNFRVGCDFLAELMGKYPLQEALTAYNSGKPGYNPYSYKVMEYYEEWRELVGDD